MLIKVGDKVTRMLAGTLPMVLEVTSIEGDVIYCGLWKFCAKTGAEIDEDMDFGPPPKFTGSYLSEIVLGFNILGLIYRSMPDSDVLAMEPPGEDATVEGVLSQEPGDGLFEFIVREMGSATTEQAALDRLDMAMEDLRQIRQGLEEYRGHIRMPMIKGSSGGANAG